MHDVTGDDGEESGPTAENGQFEAPYLPRAKGSFRIYGGSTPRLIFVEVAVVQKTSE